VIAIPSSPARQHHGWCNRKRPQEPIKAVRPRELRYARTTQATGEEIAKSRVVKGYEYDRGQFVTFPAEELKALDVESSKVIDLEPFVPGGDIDPVYFDTPYYLYPDGPIAVEALRVIGAAMTEASVLGIGRLALSRRERIVMLEPRGSGMALFTLRAADEVRAAQFGDNERDVDPEMVAIARAIIGQRLGKFDPSAYRDRYHRLDRPSRLLSDALAAVSIQRQSSRLDIDHSIYGEN
jgi:DNA end-binding protein Ku